LTKQKDSDAEIIVGGNTIIRYFVEPTVIVTTNPKYATMETELLVRLRQFMFAEDSKWSETLKLVDEV
jgi:1-pyrroline-5-carboxylate dehydrogenase